MTTVGLTGALWLVARSTKSRFEGVKVDQRLLPTTAEPDAWGEREDLGDVTFFSHERSMSTRLGWHVALVAATLVAMIAKAILAWGDTRLLLDCGNGALANLTRATDLAALDGIFISHLHPDHFVDLVAMAYALRFHPEGPLTVDVWGPDGLQEMVTRHLDQDSLGNSVTTSSSAR